MNCPECQELLQRRLDGEPVPDRTALDRHLASCAACRERHAAAQLLEDGLRALRPPTPPADLGARTVDLLLRDRRLRLRRRRFVAALAVAASLLFATFVGYLMLPFPEDEGAPEPPLLVEQSLPKPQPPVVPSEESEPTGSESLRQARAEVAALAERVGKQTGEHTAWLRTATAPLEAAPVGWVLYGRETQRIPAVQQTGLNCPPSGLSAGIQTVGGSTQRAFGYFLRKLPPLQPGPKNQN